MAFNAENPADFLDDQPSAQKDVAKSSLDEQVAALATLTPLQYDQVRNWEGERNGDQTGHPG